jgi:hypothetical protein
MKRLWDASHAERTQQDHGSGTVRAEHVASIQSGPRCNGGSAAAPGAPQRKKPWCSYNRSVAKRSIHMRGRGNVECVAWLRAGARRDRETCPLPFLIGKSIDGDAWCRKDPRLFRGFDDEC